jgi:hypothetical protein
MKANPNLKLKTLRQILSTMKPETRIFSTGFRAGCTRKIFTVAQILADNPIGSPLDESVWSIKRYGIGRFSLYCWFESSPGYINFAYAFTDADGFIRDAEIPEGYFVFNPKTGYWYEPCSRGDRPTQIRWPMAKPDGTEMSDDEREAYFKQQYQPEFDRGYTVR